MDNLTIGAPVVASLRKHTSSFLDCHLMVTDPLKWVPDFVRAGADQITFHIEAQDAPRAVIDAVRAANVRVGVSLRPRTPIEAVLPWAPLVDVVLVMTVEPGFGGQAFMEDMMPKVRLLRQQFPALDISVDGGLSPKTIDAAAAAGANAIVAGNAIFRAADPRGVIDQLRRSVLSAGFTQQ